MKKRLTVCLSKIVFGAIILLPFTAISHVESWTVLIYGHADHNLTSAILDDLLEMEQVGSSEDFNIVIQLDLNTKKILRHWKQRNNIDSKKYKGVNRLLIGEDTDGMKFSFNSKILESLSEDNNMDDPAVLKDFIKWGMAKYPADRYGLVLWNHGGQFVGYGGDTQDASLKHGQGLTTQQIRSTLTEALTGTGVNKFEFIGFDTCLMGGAEVLGDFSTLCDVFFACPELDYGDGWDYGATLNYLKANSEVDITEFARAEVGFWNAHHGDSMDQTHKVHAAYDMAKYDAFAQSFKSFSEQLKLYGQAGGEEVPKLRAEATHYSVSKSSEAKSSTHFIDLGDFAGRVAKAPVNADLKLASLNLVQAIDDMVLAKATGSLRTHVSALSIAYPHNTDDWVEHYEKKYDSISFTQGIGTDWR
ncbi:MAG TPA: clostripain-related cysteine peptidase, partial [SAR324 cluster bacterium]|nr:clostripain-related cysteine peptidase [SAR324 cluster bacterium]